MIEVAPTALRTTEASIGSEVSASREFTNSASDAIELAESQVPEGLRQPSLVGCSRPHLRHGASGGDHVQTQVTSGIENEPICQRGRSSRRA